MRSYRPSLRLFAFGFATLVMLLAAPVYAQNEVPEAETDELTFPALPLPAQILNFKDEDFAAVADRIRLGTATMQERRWFYEAAERYAPFTTTPAPDWKVKAVNAGKKIAYTGPIYRWTALGPAGDYDVTRQWGPPGSRTQGRGTALWTHTDGTRVINKNVIFLGTADGGLWKTTDRGGTWKPLTDMQPSMAVGSVDVLPGSDLTNYSDATIYVGTGEGNFSGPDKDGVGVLKSTDGGATWTVQTIPWSTDAISPGRHRIRRLRIDRNVPNAQSVWIAADGGVYHTANGGTTWSLVTGLPYAGAPATAAYPGGCWVDYATDFAVGPLGSNGKAILFAVFGRHQNAACAATPTDARKNNGVYRSTDGGVTWQKITIPGQNGWTSNANVGRIAMLVAPSNPKHIYLLVAKGNNDPTDNYKALGVWSTLDATAPTVTWIAGSTTEFTNGQGWYDLTGGVDPTNENKLMVGGLDNYLSTDGAKTLTKVSGWSAGDTSWAHADHHHALWVDGSTYYDANDGGLNIGTINGTTVTWTHANGGGLATLQFYGLGQSATNPYRINAGLQDNGHAYLDGNSWVASYGGDGGFACTDQEDDQHAYEEYVYGAIRHSADGGSTWPTQDCMQSFGACPPTCQIGNVCVPDQHMAFVTNFILDAHNSNVMYAGTNVLYRNPSARTAGKAWQRLSPLGGDFVNGSSAATAYVSIIHTPKASSVDTTLNVSNVIYIGTSTGRIWKTTDAGLTWTDLTKAPLPVLDSLNGRFVTWIDTDPTNANNVIVTYSGWNAATPASPGHVFRSTDGGVTWTDISGALPDEPFNSVAVSPNDKENAEVYVASDTGVYVNTSAWTSSSWLKVNSGVLPNVSVNMLQFTSATSPKRLRLATHGRGIWEMEKGNSPIVSLDKSQYACGDKATITVQDNNRGAGSVTVTVWSDGESRGESVVLPESPAGSGHFVGTVLISGGAAASGDGRLTVLNADTITAVYKRNTSGPAYTRTFTSTATTNCDACAGSGASGANLRIETASVATSISGGDGDEFLDNCETGRVDFDVKNIGSGSLTNLRVVRVTSSNAGVNVGTLPLTVAPSVAQCATAHVAYRFTAGGLTPGETLTLTIEVTSDELASRGIARAVSVTFKDTQQDWTQIASKTYSFENGMDGWSVVQGTFARQTTGGGAGGTATYLASSSLKDSACDEVRSPKLKLTPLSTLSIQDQFSTEPMSDAWYDRANLGIVDAATGVRTTAIPSGGRTYLASGPNGVCVVGGQPGWAGPGPAWLPSSWTAADLKLTDGRPVYIDIGYGTDSSASALGFWFDEVTITNVMEIGPDTKTACPKP